MAVASYDLKITLSEGLKAGRPITSEERGKLFGRPDLASGQASAPRLNLPQDTEEPEDLIAPSSRERLVALREKAEALSARAEKRIDKIAEECAGIDYYFDPDRHPDLAAAVSAVFPGVNSKITFDMYKRALRLDSEIMLAITEEQTSGLV